MYVNFSMFFMVTCAWLMSFGDYPLLSLKLWIVAYYFIQSWTCWCGFVLVLSLRLCVCCSISSNASTSASSGVVIVTSCTQVRRPAARCHRRCSAAALRQRHTVRRRGATTNASRRRCACWCCSCNHGTKGEWEMFGFAALINRSAYRPSCWRCRLVVSVKYLTLNMTLVDNNCK